MKFKQTKYYIYLVIFGLSYFSFISQGQYNQLHWLSTLMLMLVIRYYWHSFTHFKTKMIVSLGSLLLLSAQITYHSNIGWPFNPTSILLLPKRVWAIFFICLVLFFLGASYLWSVHTRYYPVYKSPTEFTTAAVKQLHEKGKYFIHTFEDGREKINSDSVKYVISEIPRHGYISYTSQNNLPASFFELAEKAIEEDSNLYLVLSSTGSPASEIISVFTQKEYNHISLSFDRDLQTVISYNGGNHLQRPGLNLEDIHTFHQKPDSRLIVYSLKATADQQRQILNEIKTINEEGSAYNILGLVARVSLKPNIMFCSQFVYSMLEKAELDYFEASQTSVKPTDFVEQDYFRKLQFEYEMELADLFKTSEERTDFM